MDFAEALDEHEKNGHDDRFRRIERRQDAFASTLANVELNNSNTAEAMKKAVTDAMAERDSAKVSAQLAAAGRRSWLVALYIGSLPALAGALALLHVAPEAIVIVVGAVAAAGYKALDAAAPPSPKTTGRSIPPSANGGSQ